MEHDFHRDVPFVFGNDLLAEFFLEVVADYKHYLSESGAQCVIDRIVHYGFAARAYAVELLEAAVAATHAGGEYEQGWFHIFLP